MRKLIPLFVLALALAAASAACTLSVAPTEETPNIATMIAGTMAAITQQATDTAAPATISYPTVVPPATPYPTLLVPSAVPTLPIIQPTVALPNATRISFLAGATTAIVTGPIQAGGTQNYVLEAMQGQPMIVNVSSLHNDVTLAIKTQGGTTLLSIASAQSTWQGSLPQTEDYYLTLRGGASTEDFTLNIVIPSRITFLPGTDSTKVTGKTVGGYDTSYVAFASKGQKMTLDLGNLSSNAALSVWGFSDGQPYLNGNMTQQTHFTFTLPATQDYVIQVVPQGGHVNVVSYVLNLRIQ